MTTVGLRARKMARTREQIAEAAIQAFISKGYEHTTLDEIAERADVHKRTLLRYFPTKAHLVLHTQYDALDRLREALRDRGATSAIDVWENHVIRGARSLAQRGRLANARVIAAHEPAVTQAYLAIQDQTQVMLAQALSEDAGRNPDSDIPSKVIAAALVGGNYAVARGLMEREAYDEIEPTVMEVVRIVRRAMGV